MAMVVYNVDDSPFYLFIVDEWHATGCHCTGTAIDTDTVTDTKAVAASGQYMCNCYNYDRTVHISVDVDLRTLLDRKNFSSNSNGQVAAHRVTGLIIKMFC